MLCGLRLPESERAVARDAAGEDGADRRFDRVYSVDAISWSGSIAPAISVGRFSMSKRKSFDEPLGDHGERPLAIPEPKGDDIQRLHPIDDFTLKTQRWGWQHALPNNR